MIVNWSRAVLTEVQVKDIYRLKFPGIHCPPNSNAACLVAITYGVNEKTVRDIWKGRTWRRATTQVYGYRLPSPQSRREKSQNVNIERSSLIRTQVKKNRQFKAGPASNYCCSNKLCRWGSDKTVPDQMSDTLENVSINTLLHAWVLQQQQHSEATDATRLDSTSRQWQAHSWTEYFLD
jgi:hypothetical protein